MIQRGFITEWRAQAPWADDAQVEQDLIIARTLVAIFSSGQLREQLAFRGGTALHKMFLPQPARYSEDIDLVQIAAGPIGPVLTALRRELETWLGVPRHRANAGRVTLVYRLDSEIPPVVPLRVKIEINTREHFSVLGFRQQPFSVASRWYTGTAPVTTYQLAELLGTKLRALYQRKKGRDLFDLDIALRACPELDCDQVVDCFLRYLDHDHLTVSRAQFEANLAGKLHDPVFSTEITPLLAGTEPYSVPLAAGRVAEMLISRIPGAPWRRPDDGK